MVNETLAAQYCPGQSAVGKRFRLVGDDGPWVEIAGVARDAKYTGLTEGPTRFLYLPYAQNRQSNMILMVQSAGDPAQLAAPIRELVRSIDPEQPSYEVRTMETFFEGGPVKNALVVIQSIAAMRLMGILLAVAVRLLDAVFPAGLQGGFAGYALVVPAVLVWGLPQRERGCVPPLPLTVLGSAWSSILT